MLENINLENLLFFDIETVPSTPGFLELEDDLKPLWESKVSRFLQEDEKLEDSYFDRAGIYAEFAKVICISAGFFKRDPVSGEMNFRIRSFASDDESEVLQHFADLLDKYYYDSSKYFLCGHNIKEFDVPFLCRRMLVNGVKLPGPLDIAGKKPWEVSHLDTMQLWKFGDYKSYTSLKLLAALFGIPTPKDDIDGSDVARVYWKEKDLKRIVKYCQKDVLTVAQLILRFKGQPILQEDDILIANP